METTFVVDNIHFEVTTNKECGAVTSNMDEHYQMESFHTCEDYTKNDVYGAYKDALYSFILGYILAGGDIKSKPSYAGIRSILNCIEQYDFQ